MSCTAARTSRRERRACQRCRARKALFRRRGAVRADRTHTLCFECFRAERDRQAARRLAAGERAFPLRSPFAPQPALSERQIAHRQAMLAHLEGSDPPGAVPAPGRTWLYHPAGRR